MNLSENEKDQCVAILNKPSADRSQTDIFFLSEKLSYFFINYKESIPEETYLEIYKAIKVETYKKFQVVFHYGDIGKKIYYILKGEVYVLVPKIYDVNDHSALNLTNIHSSLLPANEAEILKNYPSFLIRTILKEGMNFGEVALIIKGCRNSTIVCKEDSHLIVLTAETYHKIKKKNNHNLYSEKIDFLTEIPLFNQWRRTNISLVMFYLKEVLYKKDQYVYKQNDDVSGIYIIQEGEIEIFQSFSKQSKNESNPHKTYTKLLVSVGKLVRGQTFGEEEIFSKSKRIYYAKCSSLTAKLLFFSKKDVFDNIKSRSYLGNMKKDADLKIQYRENYFQKKVSLMGFMKTSKKTQTLTKINKNSNSLESKETSQIFSSRSNLINNYVLGVEKIEKKPQEKAQNFSLLLKNSFIANLMNTVPKYKDKVISLKEKKKLEQNYDSDLFQKIKLIVEKRMKEASLTDRARKTPPPTQKRLLKTKSFDLNLHRKHLSESFKTQKEKKNNEIRIQIKSFYQKNKTNEIKNKIKDIKSTHVEKNENKDLSENEFLFNFLIKSKEKKK